MPAFDPVVAEYRYFVADLLTNTVLAEMPFKDVSYERSLSSAGSFSGKLPVLSNTAAFDIYNNTMPGKTALYIVRDNVCVWGGIIWSRSYSLTSREISVNGSEFPSYFHHRDVWNTFAHSFSATATVASPGTAIVTITDGSFGFTDGMPVRVDFAVVGDMDYSGKYLISSAISDTQFAVVITNKATGTSLPVGSYTDLTVITRVDTYDYARQLIGEMAIDFSNLDFANVDIEPGYRYESIVTTKQITSGVATITMNPKEDPTTGAVAVVVGDTIDISGVDATFNGQHVITSTTDTTVSFATLAADVPLTSVSGVSEQVLFVNVANGVVSLYNDSITPGPVLSFAVGDRITVTGADSPTATSQVYNGTYTVVAATSHSVSYMNAAAPNIEFDTLPVDATVTREPLAFVDTYGPYPTNSDIGLSIYSEIIQTNYPTSAQIIAAGLPADLYPTTGPLPVVAGNLTLTSRPLVENMDGSVSTIYGTVYNDGSNEVVIPRVLHGAIVTEARAIEYYTSSGQHLGKFASGSVANAETYLDNLNAIQTQWLGLITYSRVESTYSGEEHVTDTPLRGHELKSVGEALNEFSDALNGFDYRVDCDYDANTGSFTRTLKLYPVKFPPALPPLAPGEAAPLERYGAQNYIFQYPGNIMEVSMDETAEDGATRFFVVGNIDGVSGSEISQPYSAAAADSLLAAGWPLLDVDEAKTDIEDKNVLYAHAKRYLTEFQPPTADITVTVNGSLAPVVGTYAPGDWCALVIDDYYTQMRLASNLEPRNDIIVRKIDGFKVDVPNNPSFPEKVGLQLVAEWGIDKVGK